MAKDRKGNSRKGRGYTPPAARQKQSGKKISKAQVLSIAAIVLIAAVGIGYLWNNADKVGMEVKTQSGLRYIDLVAGTGPSPSPGKKVKVHYTGTLTNGTKFDSSVDRGVPYEFVIGVGSVIKGWDEGVMSMKVGGKRKLIIPPELGYGGISQGKIPANSTLYFDVELLGIQ